MFTQHPIVDRKVERNKFKNLLDVSIENNISILLLKDDSGQGKSKLIKLYQEHCRDSKIPVTKIDFKNGSLDPIDILKTIQMDFRPFDFPRCNNILHNGLSNPIAPHIQIERNTGIGPTNYLIQTTVQQGPLQSDEKKDRWTTGTQAFLEDLIEIAQSRQNRFVILFDTYEQASPETKKWLCDYILRMATPRRINSLIVVIAGKEIPTPTGEWEDCHDKINLGPLDLKDWLEYAELMNVNIPANFIERAYAKHKNNPLEMASWINTLAPDIE